MGGESGEEEQQGRTHTGRNFLHNRLYQLLQNAQFNSIYWVEARYIEALVDIVNFQNKQPGCANTIPSSYSLLCRAGGNNLETLTSGHST